MKGPPSKSGKSWRHESTTSEAGDTDDLCGIVTSVGCDLWECAWLTAGSSSLSWPSLIGLWGGLRLHTCCTLSNQCATGWLSRQHTHTHTHQRGRSPAEQQGTGHVSFSTNHYNPFTFTFRAFRRYYYPKRFTIITFVRR